MTDRELLELAAKAYWGDEIDDVVSIEWGELDQAILYTHADNQDHDGHDRTYRWNPLEENGDAMLILVRLKLHLGMEDSTVSVWERNKYGNFQTEVLGDDPEGAARRAIVRTAAEIGKAMP